MFIVTCFVAVSFKEIWYQLTEDGEIIVLKHAVAT